MLYSGTAIALSCSYSRPPPLARSVDRVAYRAPPPSPGRAWAAVVERPPSPDRSLASSPAAARPPSLARLRLVASPAVVRAAFSRRRRSPAVARSQRGSKRHLLRTPCLLPTLGRQIPRLVQARCWLAQRVSCRVLGHNQAAADAVTNSAPPSHAATHRPRVGAVRKHPLRGGTLLVVESMGIPSGMWKRRGCPVCGLVATPTTGETFVCCHAWCVGCGGCTPAVVVDGRAAGHGCDAAGGSDCGSAACSASASAGAAPLLDGISSVIRRRRVCVALARCDERLAHLLLAFE